MPHLNYAVLALALMLVMQSGPAAAQGAASKDAQAPGAPPRPLPDTLAAKGEPIVPPIRRVHPAKVAKEAANKKRDAKAGAIHASKGSLKSATGKPAKAAAVDEKAGSAKK